MSYKVKNGAVWVMFNGMWWLDSVLFTIYPDLKGSTLVKVA